MRANKISVAVFTATIILVFPVCAMAQGVIEDINGLQKVLEKVYDEMITLCSSLISVARGIAGFGALWFIATRVWGNIARAEPVDFYPLLRPFALGLAILLFPAVIGAMNGVLKPTVSGTAKMVKDGDKAIKALLKQKEIEMKKTDKWKYLVGDDGMGDRKEWYRFTHPEDKNGNNENWIEAIGNNMRFWLDKQDYKMRHSVKQFMSEGLQVVYYSAALCINTLRTFFLIVLAILGPLVFGLSVFDGLQHTLSVWVARYINIYLWLPIANLFGTILSKIQQNMIKLDIDQVQQNGDTFFSSTDTAYLIFMIIGIVGYFCVPTVANFIIHAGGGNSMLTKINTMSASAINAAQKSDAKNQQGMEKSAGMIADRFGDDRRNVSHGMAEAGGQNYFNDKLSGK
ncbi:conjugative transposon protein TraJ [Pedobacter sp. KBW06]|uniref:conjugative transposon protein TraJ n=1 Tax=Pedobacter sp. KBW06 TaxID=2153359 RepID=UPI000F5A0067|nr:conjugative transposon protein TraJ [Pedobacter sp. KBW06]RQO74505.1 conjugative transposon protein TraJ [Pedobacter sp. KBW06]